MALHTCISPEGTFRVGRHFPAFSVENMRRDTHVRDLGVLDDGTVVENQVNFPATGVTEPKADPIYEIPNPFPFRGTTYINTAWADAKAADIHAVRIPEPPPCRFLKSLSGTALANEDKDRLIRSLPHALRLALAQASTDPEELQILARQTASLILDPESGRPVGMNYIRTKNGGIRPDIPDHDVFEVLVNNPCLPDDYKEVMVLRPGVQGRSEIVGDITQGTHVFEYLRRNSYIPWGHFAANMANDAIRYRASELTVEDMAGIRHLYYQRTFVRMAGFLDIPLPATGRDLSVHELEALRLAVKNKLDRMEEPPPFSAALWGWNYGFGAAQSGHRLHASHQMIHQQNALIPHTIENQDRGSMQSFAYGDLVQNFIQAYKTHYGTDFFKDYLRAIETNTRTDQGHCPDSDRPASLKVFEDDHILVFAPKAQVSEFELQVMTRNPCPHILAADTATRAGLDKGILMAVQVLDGLGAKMVTGIEVSGRFYQGETGQHLIYSFIPRLPYAPPTFSEAQLRYISGCYPEDFAHACRRVLTAPQGGHE